VANEKKTRLSAAFRSPRKAGEGPIAQRKEPSSAPATLGNLSRCVGEVKEG
jgi:hypothetical protein